MLLQVKVPTESLPTSAACEGLFIIVGMHVKCQIIDLVERFVAYITFELLLSTVCQFVVLVVSWREGRNRS